MKNSNTEIIYLRWQEDTLKSSRKNASHVEKKKPYTWCQKCFTPQISFIFIFDELFKMPFTPITLI